MYIGRENCLTGQESQLDGLPPLVICIDPDQAKSNIIIDFAYTPQLANTSLSLI